MPDEFGKTMQNSIKQEMSDVSMQHNKTENEVQEL